ncbi:hypothetical protein N7495_003432 [Penicillium taxi]|uniref:uncharacterized protein n=1 Tax=Penicillium taxi TaxID=168475 RepID=UPI002544EB7D|nr:uncharacterized protein N7495_003432 [Penicillium taxi]KAJ5902904.1 hypothetical protein N7495_003432 [Penicillium taxi]
MAIDQIKKRLMEETGLVLNPPERLDLRPEEEIRAQLNSHVPVQSEKNVWAYWDKGFDAMPAWRQRNVIDWIRRNGKRWDVRVLDIVPSSPNHISRFIDSAYFPAGLYEGLSSDGQHAQAIADFFRISTVYQHGGVYMDVGIMPIRDLDDICWSTLEDPSSPYQVCAVMVGKIALVNYFLAARKGDPFVHRWLRLFLEVWGNRETAKGICHHPLISHLGLIKSPIFPPTTDWEELTDYGAITQCCARVKDNREPGEDGFDGPAYFQKHFFVLPDVPEFAGPELSASDFRKALLTPYSQDENASETEKKDQEEASQLVHSTLAGKSAYKFYSGFAKFGVKGLAAKVWDQPEHANEESLPGTWGEVFRYGTVHFRQTRTVEPIVVPQITPITEVGLFEPVTKV